jgi:CheY-like chemotaxis protein
MVGRLSGTVTATHEPGALTRVEVLLPLATRGQEPAVAKKFRHRLAPSAIWVVDDDPIFREMCHQVLQENGHAVQDIPSGRELMERWPPPKGKQPDLMLIDFSMPEYNGLELCEWLREKGARMPIVLVSGFAANQPDIKKALKMKKTYFLQKPFTARDLTDTVTVALGETLIGE